MANVLYPNFKENLLKGRIDFETATVNAYLVDTDRYTYSDAHTLLVDLTVASRISSATLSGQTVVDGTLDVNDFTFASVTGDEAEAIVISVDNGGTEYLVAYYDTGVTGLPVIPNTGDINVAVNISGLFDL